MKTLFLIITLFSSLISYTQDQDMTKYLTKSVWKLKSDEMKGIGSHTSLPKGTQIEFLADGTWKSSARWNGSSQGKWQLKDQSKTISIIFSSTDQKEFKVTVNERELQLRLRDKVASSKLTWVANTK